MVWSKFLSKMENNYMNKINSLVSVISRAKLLLRKKKYQEGLLDKTEKQLDNIERLTQDLEFTQVEKQVSYCEPEYELHCLRDHPCLVEISLNLKWQFSNIRHGGPVKLSMAIRATLLCLFSEVDNLVNCWLARHMKFLHQEARVLVQIDPPSHRSIFSEFLCRSLMD